MFSSRTFYETSHGVNFLNGVFKFCEKSNFDTFYEFNMDLFSMISMANYPYPAEFRGNLPAYPIREFCSRINGVYDTDEDLVLAFKEALQVFTNYTGTEKCLSFHSKSPVDDSAWGFQRCTELIFPDCSNGTSKDELFKKYTWNFQEFSNDCYNSYNIRPQEKILIEEYGSSYEHGSNIIFSNGLLDPWSGYGILGLFNEKHTIVIMPDTAHHLDLRADNQADPKSVQNARELYLNIFNEWIDEIKKRYIL